MAGGHDEAALIEMMCGIRDMMMGTNIVIHPTLPWHYNKCHLANLSCLSGLLLLRRINRLNLVFDPLVVFEFPFPLRLLLTLLRGDLRLCLRIHEQHQLAEKVEYRWGVAEPLCLLERQLDVAQILYSPRSRQIVCARIQSLR